MNPEDNQPTAEPVPSLDQVAADLAANPDAAADIPEQSSESTTEPTTSQPITEQPAVESATVVGTEPTTTEPTVEPTTEPIFEPTPEPAVVAPEPTTPPATLENPLSPEATAAPEASSAPETSLAPETPPEPTIAAPDSLVAPTTVSAAAVTPESETPAEVSAVTPEPETPTETSADAPLEPESTSITSANFVGDAPESQKASTDSSEDEEQLQPADPVPGSIGSALVYSETAPNHAMPVSELQKKRRMSMGLSKDSIRTILIIVAAVALVATLVVVLIFIFSGNSATKKNNTSSNTNNTPTTTMPVVASLTCTKTGTGESFPDSGETTYGEESIIAMYTDDELTSLGSTTTLEYNSVESADSGLNTVRGNYTSKLESLGILSDPFTSSYNVNGTTLTVSHQADAEDIDNKSGKIFGLMSVRGQVVTDSETLKDSYEENGYECLIK